jgi:hypothetical protein
MTCCVQRRMSPVLAPTGPTGPVWRCPFVGEDRKWRLGATRTVVDPDDIGSRVVFWRGEKLAEPRTQSRQRQVCYLQSVGGRAERLSPDADSFISLEKTQEAKL